MRHYAQYIAEREGFKTLDYPYGFATFKVMGDECYIRDIWVHPDFRKDGKASALADMIAKKAKECGATYLTGTVDPKTKNATTSLKVLLGYGFQLIGFDDRLIWFKKEV